MEALRRLVVELCARESNASTRSEIARGRLLAKQHKLPCNPVGAGNTKTGVPSTYRPVGQTCPADCPFLDGSCYALHGHVNLQQQRATPSSLASLTSAAVAMVTAVRAGTSARLHVSGDFALPDGSLDLEYVFGLCEIAQLIRHLLDPTRGPLAWGYTHLHERDFEPYRLLLKACDIEILYSDRAIVGGVMTWPFEELEGLHEEFPHLQLVRCREQLDDKLTCNECRLCWDAGSKGLTIVFDPHGPRQQQIEARLSA